MQREVRSLIFVYAANSGLIGAMFDSAKKLLHVNGCSLCALTHGLAGERDEWTSCKEALGVPVEYLHRDELEGELRDLVGERLPCVVADSDDGLRLLLSPEVIARCDGKVADLRGKLRYHAAKNDLRL